MEEMLMQIDAPDMVMEWAANKSIEQAWGECHRGDCMLWLAGKLGVDTPVLILAAGLCANTARHFMLEETTRKAVDVAIRYGKGDATDDELGIMMYEMYLINKGHEKDIFDGVYCGTWANSCTAMAVHAACRGHYNRPFRYHKSAYYAAEAYASAASDAYTKSVASVDFDTRNKVWKSVYESMGILIAQIVRDTIPIELIKEKIEYIETKCDGNYRSFVEHY